MKMNTIFMRNNVLMAVQGCQGIENGQVKVLKEDGDITTFTISFSYGGSTHTATVHTTASDSLAAVVKRVGELILSTITKDKSASLKLLPGWEKPHMKKQLMVIS
ncbi:hypothetical protein D3C78_19410 [compost metagenome]